MQTILSEPWRLSEFTGRSFEELIDLIGRNAAEGIDTLETYAGPTTGFTEQVYCYDLLADKAGRTLAMLYNAAADRGLALRFLHNELPCFTVWKMRR